VVRPLSADLAPDLAVENVGPLDARIAGALSEPRTRTWIVVAFAGVALTLAAIGLYGLLAGEVAARVKEIGIRLALGAAPSQVLGQTISRGWVSPRPAWHWAWSAPRRRAGRSKPSSLAAAATTGWCSPARSPS
jgi:hypothetical protein